MNVPTNRPIADFFTDYKYKAKDLATEMTNVNVQAKDLYGQSPIEKNILITILLYVICYCKGGLGLNNFLLMRDIKRYSVG